MKNQKIEANKRAVGKTVFVIDHDRRNTWRGVIVGVVDEETLEIKDERNALHQVSIFDIRYNE